MGDQVLLGEQLLTDQGLSSINAEQRLLTLSLQPLGLGGGGQSDLPISLLNGKSLLLLPRGLALGFEVRLSLAILHLNQHLPGFHVAGVGSQDGSEQVDGNRELSFANLNMSLLNLGLY